MSYLYTGNVAIIDLPSGEIEERSLEDDFVAEHIGGAAANLALYKEFEAEDPIVIGSGLFTATMVPGGAPTIITAKSPVTGKVAHAPIVLIAGAELKLAGFDFMVIKGASDKPVYLWVHDEIADVSPADQLWGMDTWATTEALRKSLGDVLIQVVSIGTVGEKGSPNAQLCTNFWGSGDKLGFGGLFGKKNLKAIACRGLGLLEIADSLGMEELCFKTREEIKKGKALARKGVAGWAKDLGAADVESWLKPLVHRHTACFACMYTCNTFAKYNELPSVVDLTEVTEPGFMITDLSGLLALKSAGLDAETSSRALELCARAGADPTRVGMAMKDAKSKDLAGVKATIECLAAATSAEPAAFPVGSPEATQLKGSVFSQWAAPSAINPDFAVSGDKLAWWQRRNALAYTFGICPIFALMAPELSDKRIVELAKLGAELDLDEDKLSALANKVINQT